MVNFVFVVIAAFMMLLLIAKKIFHSHKLVKRFGKSLENTVLVVTILILGLYFYRAKHTTGVFAVGLGGIAIAKYLYENRNERG